MRASSISLSFFRHTRFPVGTCTVHTKISLRALPVSSNTWMRIKATNCSIALMASPFFAPGTFSFVGCVSIRHRGSLAHYLESQAQNSAFECFSYSFKKHKANPLNKAISSSQGILELHLRYSLAMVFCKRASLRLVRVAFSFKSHIAACKLVAFRRTRTD